MVVKTNYSKNIHRRNFLKIGIGTGLVGLTIGEMIHQNNVIRKNAEYEKFLKSLTPYERKLLKEYKEDGRPYLFKGAFSKELLGECREKGWDPCDLTDEQVMYFYRISEEIGGTFRALSH